jgi:hypothetical protein
VAEFQSPPKALMSRTDALNRRASVSIALRRTVSAAFSVGHDFKISNEAALIARVRLIEGPLCRGNGGSFADALALELA